MMAVCPNEIEVDAAIPSPGRHFDVVLGPLSGNMAECKYALRDTFYREMVCSTSFWTSALLQLVPSFDIREIEEDEGTVVVTMVTPSEVNSANEGIDAASRIHPVHIPTVDE